LIENVDYVFKCVSFTDTVEQLTLVNGTCDVGVSSITITRERQEQGIQFSYPIYSTGLSVLVKATDARSGGWAWVQPFSLDLWLSVGLTVVIFPILLFLIEFGSLKRRIYLRDAIHGVDVATMRALHTVLATTPLEVSSSGAKVASLVFLFMSMIIITTYTANLAAVLTVNQINSQITSIEQLRGKAVTSNGIYLERLRSRYGILAVQLSDDDPAALAEAARLVVNGELAAVITDKPLLDDYLQNIPGCDVRQLSNALLEPFAYGFGVREGIDAAYVTALSGAVLKLQEEGDLQDLAESFLGFNARDDCGNTKTENYSINFYSLYGLWVLLGAGVVIGFILMMFSRRQRKKLAQSKESKRNGLDGDGDGMHPMPQRRELVTLGGLSEEAEAQDLDKQKQQRDRLATVASVSVKNNKPTTTASGKWKEVMNKLSPLQTRDSIFTPSVWHSRDDIELQQTTE